MRAQGQDPSMVASDHGAGLKQAKELGENFTWLGGTLIGAFREAANNLSAELIGWKCTLGTSGWLWCHTSAPQSQVPSIAGRLGFTILPLVPDL